MKKVLKITSILCAISIIFSLTAAISPSASALQVGSNGKPVLRPGLVDNMNSIVDTGDWNYGTTYGAWTMMSDGMPPLWEAPLQGYTNNDVFFGAPASPYSLSPFNTLAGERSISYNVEGGTYFGASIFIHAGNTFDNIKRMLLDTWGDGVQLWVSSNSGSTWQKQTGNNIFEIRRITDSQYNPSANWEADLDIVDWLKSGNGGAWSPSAIMMYLNAGISTKLAADVNMVKIVLPSMDAMMATSPWGGFERSSFILGAVKSSVTPITQFSGGDPVIPAAYDVCPAITSTDANVELSTYYMTVNTKVSGNMTLSTLKTKFNYSYADLKFYDSAGTEISNLSVNAAYGMKAMVVSLNHSTIPNGTVIAVYDIDATGEYNQNTGLNFTFDGNMSKEVLNNYLSRIVTATGFISGSAYGNVPAGLNANFEEDFRLIKRTGAMYIARAAFIWGSVPDIDAFFNDVASYTSQIHAFNSKIIVEGSLLEAVTKDFVNNIPIPSWVFTEFGQTVTTRNFNFNSMVFNANLSDGSLYSTNYWGTDTAIPDMTKLESRMFFYYLTKRYIDSGVECFHMGQMGLMGANDTNMTNITDLFDRIRNYAATNARRHKVLLSAHIYSGKSVYKNGNTTLKNLLYDFHTYPIRPSDTGNVTQSDGYQPVTLKKNFIDAIYGKSAGGNNPNGWSTTYNPYFVEFDNHGWDPATANTAHGDIKPWGYDEITWFSRQPENRREEIIRSFKTWIEAVDGSGMGHLSMPMYIPLAYKFNKDYTNAAGYTYNVKDIYHFRANKTTDRNPKGFNLESVIKSVWS